MAKPIPITGAFGFNLGQALEVKNPHFTAASRHTYLFSLKHPYRHFDTYCLGLTTSGQIASISCSRMFTNATEFESEKKTIAALFKAKYGKPANDGSAQATSLSDIEFIRPGRELSIMATFPRIDIVCSDYTLAQTMLKEMKEESPANPKTP